MSYTRQRRVGWVWRALLLPLALGTGLALAGPAQAGPPVDVRVTNLRETTFTVSWVSAQPETGYVDYGPGITLTNRASDVRGASFSGTVHQVRVDGLDPNATYSFRVTSGATPDSTVRQVITSRVLRSPPSLGPTIIGQALRADGSPAEELVLYLRVEDRDSQGTSGQSAWMSVLTGPNGVWSTNLYNFRRQPPDGDQIFFSSAAVDQLFVEAEGCLGANCRGTATVDNAEAVAGRVKVHLNQEMATPTPTPPGAASPLPTLTSTATPTPTPPSAGAPPPTNTPLPPSPTPSSTPTLAPTEPVSTPTGAPPTPLPSPTAAVLPPPAVASPSPAQPTKPPQEPTPTPAAATQPTAPTPSPSPAAPPKVLSPMPPPPAAPGAAAPTASATPARQPGETKAPTPGPISREQSIGAIQGTLIAAGIGVVALILVIGWGAMTAWRR